MNTTVIIPNYNGLAYLKECLASLDALQEEFTIYIVDNGSTDGSVAYLQQFVCSKPMEVMYLEENTGFCHAVNVGITAAKTPYVLLLNNDTVVKESFVKALEDAIMRADDIFSVSAKMLVLKDPSLVDDAGDYYCALGYAFGAGKGKPSEQYTKSRRIFSACGGAAIYRKEVLMKIGLFDENHFAYLEDVDLGYRARIYGYRNEFIPDAQVLHAGSAVSGSRHNAFKVRLAAKNNIYLIWKNMPMMQLLLNLPFILLGILGKTVFFTRKGLAKVYLNGIIQGISLCTQEEARLHKVHFQMRHFCNYCRIQWELWVNMFRMFAGI